MIIYGLNADRSNNKILVMKEDNSVLLSGKSKFDTLDLFIGRGDKKGDQWNPPALEWFDDDGRNLDKFKDPDITYFGSSATLMFSEKAKELVKAAVSDVAELLPVLCNSETWYFMNVFNQITAMDKANSTYKIYRTGEVGYLLKPAFFPDKVPHAKLFTVPEDPATIYYAEHHPDDDPNTFKNIVEKNKLFGIRFAKVQED